MNIRWYEFKTNKEIREMSKKLYISTIISIRRWGYYGHALKMNNTKIPKQLTKWNTTGKRKRGRPKKTYVEHLRERGQSNRSSVQAKPCRCSS